MGEEVTPAEGAGLSEYKSLPIFFLSVSPFPALPKPPVSRKLPRLRGAPSQPAASLCMMLRVARQTATPLLRAQLGGVVAGTRAQRAAGSLPPYLPVRVQYPDVQRRAEIQKGDRHLDGKGSRETVGKKGRKPGCLIPEEEATHDLRVVSWSSRLV